MSWYDFGNPPIDSATAQPTAAPSTSSLIAEIDSTQLGTANLGSTREHRIFRTTWLCGASTSAIFKLEVANSTAEADVSAVKYVYTPTAQSAQYVFNVRVTKDSRLRVRMDSTAATATAAIQAEALT